MTILHLLRSDADDVFWYETTQVVRDDSELRLSPFLHNDNMNKITEAKPDYYTCSAGKHTEKHFDHLLFVKYINLSNKEW